MIPEIVRIDPKDARIDLVRFISQRTSATGTLSAEDTVIVIENLVHVSLGVSREIADELVSLVRAAQGAMEVNRRMAGQPRQMVTAVEWLEDAALRGEVEHRIYEEKMVDAEEAGRLLGSRSATNPRQHANKLRAASTLLGVPYRNSYVYPTFQFDIRRRRVHPIVERVNKLLEAKNDPWGVASWWITPSERLNGRCPRDLLGKREEPGIEALANAELEPIG
jgi:hypothetical protein